jgi:hypothetical protein
MVDWVPIVVSFEMSIPYVLFEISTMHVYSEYSIAPAEITDVRRACHTAKGIGGVEPKKATSQSSTAPTATTTTQPSWQRRTTTRWINPIFMLMMLMM